MLACGYPAKNYTIDSNITILIILSKLVNLLLIPAWASHTYQCSNILDFNVNSRQNNLCWCHVNRVNYRDLLIFLVITVVESTLGIVPFKIYVVRTFVVQNCCKFFFYVLSTR